MPTIKVKLLAALKEVAGLDEVSLEAESWSRALVLLRERVPALQSAIAPDGVPRPGFLAFVDGVDSRLLDRNASAREVVLLPVNHGGTQFEVVGWDVIEKAIDKIAKDVEASNFKPEIIVGIMRGGIIPGRLIADRLNVEDIGTIEIKLYVMPGQRGERPYLRQPLTLPVKDKNVLLVDDVSDSGLTLQFAVQALSLYMPREIRTSTLYIKPWTKFIPDYYADQTDRWMVFPWEVSEFRRELAFLRGSSNT